VERLKESALKLGVSIAVHDLRPGEKLPDFGDFVLWRSSSLGASEERLTVMQTILKETTLINRCLAVLPRATEKSFQQEYAQEKTKFLKGIPTFTFTSLLDLKMAIETEVLSYPFIQKPNKGSKGEGVELIQNEDELLSAVQDIEQQVYQNFIQNNGDYRVFILGGRMLGAIKRTAADGGFLNNISKGGSGEVVTDQKILNKLRKIGTTVASVFELTLCGVDVIFDEVTQEYLFLEVNTVPQWKGFEQATGIDVAHEIIQYCLRMYNRNKISTFDLVSQEYRSQLAFLGSKKFHLLSRLYLWNRESALKDSLLALQKDYMGTCEEDYRKKLAKIFSHTPEHGDRMIAREARQMYFDKYPSLEPFLSLLFKNLFAQEIYGVNLKKYIAELVSETALFDLKLALENDLAALQTLSTHAINYLYMLEEYLGNEKAPLFPEKLLAVGKSYPDNSFELQIYFFTHCIIGASKFYSREIPRADIPTYTDMLVAIEKIIQHHFQKISLDNKFEFLVCAKLCGYASQLEKEILTEANRSLAPDGNFLIDTHNIKADPEERNDFVSSEHRNVLYLMSQSTFHPSN
jgi:RimK family alpha-L-glutamate ligase